MLARSPAVKAALDAARRNEPKAIEQEIRICEIPAPPFHETVRGRELERLFTALGLKNVRTDQVGNVIGTRPGRSPHPNLVFSAHLDTVFPEGTDVKVTREGNLLKGPGIGDDCRGLALMLSVIESLNEAHVETPGTITFVADVGEEGLGDLRGVKNLFHESLKGDIDKFVSVDGTGFGITNVGVGSMRYRVTFKGPGGHSYGAFGMANPIHAMGRAIAKISDFEVPAEAKNHVQCRPRRRRNIRQRDRVRGLDGDGHAVGRRALLEEARRKIQCRDARGRRGREPALEQPRQSERISGAGRAASRPAARRPIRRLFKPRWQFRARWISKTRCMKAPRIPTFR